MENHSSLEHQPDLLTGILENPVEYAGFWLRFAAYMIDLLIFYVLAVFIGVVITINYRLKGIAKMPENAMELLVLGTYIGFFVYFPLMECSQWQATVGKRAVSIKVTNDLGLRISFLKAWGRLFAKILSALILGIGFIMAGFTDKKKALHDMIANTLVVKGRS